MIAPASLKDKIPSIYKMVPMPQPRAEEPPPAGDSVDFQDITTPQQVALLPTFDPAFGVALFTAAIAGAISGAPSVGISLSATMGDKSSTIQYSVGRAGMSSLGSIGSASIT